ncbi:unnamed protein product [Sphacelaria rigidula]
MTNCESIEATIRKRQLCFAGALVGQEDTRLPERVMNGWLSTRGPKEAGRPPQAMGGYPPGEHTCALGAVPHEGARRKRCIRLGHCGEEHGQMAYWSR